jgi:Zn-dependent peptidase ImmA (M78 family)
MPLREDGRSRMTFAHELGHLVMHPGAAKLRSATALAERQTKYFESAEWQARKFAALFLVPDHIALQFNSAKELAAACNISTQAAQIRFDETAPLRKPRFLSNMVSDIIQELKGQ